MSAPEGEAPANLIDADATDCRARIAGGGLVLVDFWAGWCGPCRALKPVLTELAEQHPKLSVVKVDIEAEGALADEMGVQSIPSLLLFKGGDCVERMVGRIPYPILARTVARHA